MSEVAAAMDAARLTEFARAFKAAARSVVLYPEAHPAITATLGRLTRITNPPELTSALRIGVTADTLLIGGATVSRPDAAIAELSALFHAHLIGELTVLAGGDQSTWRNFLLLVGRAPDVVRAEGGIARLWSTMAGQQVEIREIDYAEVLRERTSGAAATWAQVVANCLSGDSFEISEELIAALLDGSSDKELLANTLAELDKAEAGGPGLVARTAALIRLLGVVLRAVSARAPDRVEPVMQDLAAALGRLSPEMLVALVNQGRQQDSATAATVSAVVSRMADGTIASFVARHAGPPGAAIERVAQAFQALVVDQDRRERLVSMAHRSAQQASEGDADFERRWEGAARQLLEYSDESYVSDAYARELTRSRTQAVQVEQMNEDPPERLAAWLGSVATSELRKLDLALMLDLLRIEHEPGRCAALVGPVLSLLEDLFLVGDFEAADAVLGALRFDDATQTVERREFARDILARLVTASTMGHIIGHLATVDHAQFERVKGICQSLGGTLVRPLAEALAVEERSRTRERLTEVLIGFGSIGRDQVEQLKTSANPAVRRTAIYLLREFGGSEALPELTELLDDDEPGVQREAVRAILKIGTDRGYRVLEQALASGTARSRDAIMQALGSGRDERAAPLLVYIVEHVDHTGTLGWVYARALDLLGQLRDPDSVPALSAALHRGEWWAPRRTAALRSSAAAALARIGTEEAVGSLADAARTGSRGVRSAARTHLESVGRGRVGGARG